MRGFLALEPDKATFGQLLMVQNRLRDGLTRQGVNFPDRLGPTLLTWPFGRAEEIAEAALLLADLSLQTPILSRLEGRPNGDRPAEIGFAVTGVEEFQQELFVRLRSTIDPDPPRSAFIRLVRISPASRKVGAALRSLDLGEAPPFHFQGLGLWVQTPTGFELAQEITLERR